MSALCVNCLSKMADDAPCTYCQQCDAAMCKKCSDRNSPVCVQCEHSRNNRSECKFCETPYYKSAAIICQHCHTLVCSKFCSHPCVDTIAAPSAPIPTQSQAPPLSQAPPQKQNSGTILVNRKRVHSDNIPARSAATFCTDCEVKIDDRDLSSICQCGNKICGDCTAEILKESERILCALCVNNVSKCEEHSTYYNKGQNCPQCVVVVCSQCKTRYRSGKNSLPCPVCKTAKKEQSQKPVIMSALGHKFYCVSCNALNDLTPHIHSCKKCNHQICDRCNLQYTNKCKKHFYEPTESSSEESVSINASPTSSGSFSAQGSPRVPHWAETTSPDNGVANRNRVTYNLGSTCCICNGFDNVIVGCSGNNCPAKICAACSGFGAAYCDSCSEISKIEGIDAPPKLTTLDSKSGAKVLDSKSGTSALDSKPGANVLDSKSIAAAIDNVLKQQSEQTEQMYTIAKSCHYCGKYGDISLCYGCESVYACSAGCSNQPYHGASEMTTGDWICDKCMTLEEFRCVGCHQPSNDITRCKECRNYYVCGDPDCYRSCGRMGPDGWICLKCVQRHDQQQSHEYLTSQYYQMLVSAVKSSKYTAVRERIDNEINNCISNGDRTYTLSYINNFFNGLDKILGQQQQQQQQQPRITKQIHEHKPEEPNIKQGDKEQIYKELIADHNARKILIDAEKKLADEKKRIDDEKKRIDDEKKRIDDAAALVVKQRNDERLRNDALALVQQRTLLLTNREQSSKQTSSATAKNIVNNITPGNTTTKLIAESQITMIRMGKQIEELKSTLKSFDKRFDHINERFDHLESMLQSVFDNKLT